MRPKEVSSRHRTVSTRSRHTYLCGFFANRSNPTCQARDTIAAQQSRRSRHLNWSLSLHCIKCLYQCEVFPPSLTHDVKWCCKSHACECRHPSPCRSCPKCRSCASALTNVVLICGVAKQLSLMVQFFQYSLPILL